MKEPQARCGMCKHPVGDNKRFHDGCIQRKLNRNTVAVHNLKAEQRAIKMDQVDDESVTNV